MVRSGHLILYLKIVAEIGDEYVNKNPGLDDTQYNFPLLNKGYKDTNDYDGKLITL